MMHRHFVRTVNSFVALLLTWGLVFVAPGAYAQKGRTKATPESEDPALVRVSEPTKGEVVAETPNVDSEGKREPKADSPKADGRSFTNSTAITISDCPEPCPASGQAASLYPSPIVVSGQVGVIRRVSVSLNGFSHGSPADVDFLLVSPSGRKIVLRSDFAAGSPEVSNLNVAFDDSANTPAPDGNAGGPIKVANRPANSGTADAFPATAPAGPYTNALSAFNGDAPNGTWKLYIVDNANLNGGKVSGGWTITFDVGLPSTIAGQTLMNEVETRPADMTPSAPESGANAFIGFSSDLNPKPLSLKGVKVSDFLEEPTPVVRSQIPGAKKRTMQEQNGPIGDRPTGAATSYTNATPITITDCPNPCLASQAASLYPSPIVVAGEVGVVQRVSVTLNGFSHAFPADVDFLLVSPLGRKSVIMSDFGAGSPGVANINVTLDDYADRPVPSAVTGNTGVPFVTGSYRPANSGTTDLFPAAAPASPYTYTLSAFNGDSPNGTWNLYIIDDANLDPGSISGGWTISFDVRPPAPTAGQILISEFRTRGAGTAPPGSDGGADEFIEIYNNTDQNITIIDALPGADPTSAPGAGWRFAGAQGAAETTFFVLPQTLSTAGPLALPPRGHFLVSTQPTVPSPAGNTYSLATYPTGTGVTASGSANIAVNPSSAAVGFLPDDVGLAIFSTAAALTANRLDSVGYGSVTAADYKEGTGLPPAAGITTSGQHSWVRKMETGNPQDTDNNANDFVLVETNGAALNGVPAVLGAPGPERGPTATAYTTTSAPIQHNADMPGTLIDLSQLASAPPNRVRDLTPVTNGTFGTLKIRRRITNNTGLPIIALRYRVVIITTLTGAPLPPGQADLRVLESSAQAIVLTDTSVVNSEALTLQTPAAQPNGGGLNSTLAEGVITTTAPLANGASTIVEFNLGVQQTGLFRFYVNIEALTVPPQ